MFLRLLLKKGHIDRSSASSKLIGFASDRQYGARVVMPITKVKGRPGRCIYNPETENWAYINRILLESLNLLFIILGVVLNFDTRFTTKCNYP